jgi:formimidoylglutamate deiminase
MTSYVAAAALLPDGWSRDVRIDVGSDGVIAAVARDVPAAAASDALRLAGPVVPAMPNLHSHAFQRALAGRTGRAAASGGDSFWTWRQAMYRMLERLDADGFAAVTAQAYVDMARAGYGSVAEFHYVHHDPAGRPYADPGELALGVVAAARDAGLALTMLPVFYAHAGFGGTPAVAGQRRFLHTTPSFARLVERLVAGTADDDVVVGVAPHSLRAVTPDELREVVAVAPAGAPVHIHVAEQAREVDDCVAWSGQRPVQWLLDHARVDPRWCLVHATHVTADEVRDLAATGAAVGLAPTTEADLGDGTFPGESFVAAGGRFGVGSDSNVAIDPFAELRQLEWSQRLQLGRRNVLADGGASVGTALWAAAARGGARACGRATGVIAAGHRADLVVLDPDDPALAGVAADDVLDAAIFGPCRRPVRDVLVGGRFVVREGRHPRQEAVLARFRDALARMMSA